LTDVTSVSESLAARRFADKVVVVTGGSRGIGRAIAVAFGRHGAAVVICGRDDYALADTEARIMSESADCLASRCDVSDPREVDELASKVRDRFGVVHTVVAAAGDAGPVAGLAETDYEDWRACLASNLDGAFLTFRAFLPLIPAHGGGSVIAFSSITGKRPLQGRTAYGAAKMGVIGLVRVLALELGPRGIRVNAVCPGGVAGARLDESIRRLALTSGRSEEDVRRDFADASPLARLVETQDVVDACLFLASDQARAITGEDLNLSNGLVMY
jgi:NAD(P)-dependent dehydrogenase (short-subunit alcohol dehydrogenase family)